MNPEQRKEYNQNYYKTNKNAIIQKGCEKKECVFCHKLVSHNNMAKHQVTRLCENRQQKLIKEALRKENFLEQ